VPWELNSSLPDCVCADEWVNFDGLCNPRWNQTLAGVRMVKCPSLETIQLCDYTAEQSYCYTTQTTCKQQLGSMEGQSWAYCNDRTEETELPPCTCKSRWANTECASSTAVMMNGCPSPEAMAACDPNFDVDDDQPWCETNEPICQQQEDGPNELMVGRGWAYCDPEYQETELPECECQQTWSPDAADCTTSVGSTLSFRGCPPLAAISACQDNSNETQSWCKTTRARCREQTYSVDGNDAENMRNDSWAYCNPSTGDVELPECECLGNWTNADEECEDAPINMKGCPATSELTRCDATVTQPWCDTTYWACKEQPSASEGDGWAFCNAETGDAEPGECECEAAWYITEGTCGHLTGLTAGQGIKRGLAVRGCPPLEQIQRCDPTATQSWCDTTEWSCKGQTGEQVGEGYVTCDPDTQRALPGDVNDKVVTAVAVSVVTTLVLVACVVVVAIFLLAKRRRRQMRGFKMMRNDTDEEITAVASADNPHYGS